MVSSRFFGLIDDYTIITGGWRQSSGRRPNCHARGDQCQEKTTSLSPNQGGTTAGAWPPQTTHQLCPSEQIALLILSL